MIELFDGSTFHINNRYVQKAQGALQAIALLLTTRSPLLPYDVSLIPYIGRNNDSALAAEIAIKIKKINDIITAQYGDVIKSVTLGGIEKEKEDSLVITLDIVTDKDKLLSLEVEVT